MSTIGHWLIADGAIPSAIRYVLVALVVVTTSVAVFSTLRDQIGMVRHALKIFHRPVSSPEDALSRFFELAGGVISAQFLFVLILGVVGLVLGAAGRWVFSTLVATRSWVESTHPWAIQLIPALIALIGIVSANVLFILRDRRRVSYGAVEILVAVAALFNVVRPDQPMLGCLAFATAIYVLVRGLDNVHQGLKNDDRCLKLLKEFEAKLLWKAAG